MQIAQFNDSFPPQTDGVAQAVRNYALWLNRKYGECCVVTPKFAQVQDREEFPVIRFVSVPTFVDKDYNMGLPDIAFKTSRTLDTMPLDILHSHCPFASGTLALMTARKKNLPLVATFHSKYADDFSQRLKMENAGKIVARYVAKYYAQADEAWTVNASTARTLQEYGYRGPVTVMPNGCDFEPMERSEETRRKVLARYGLPERPLLLFVGRIVEQKNIAFLLKAAQMLGDTDFSLMLVGEGTGERAYRKMVAQMGLQEKVKFTGAIRSRDALREIYASSDLFVLPSVYDTDGLVKREAASCGCPSALITESNAAEGITDGVNGFTSELNEEAFSAVMAKVLANPGLGRAVGEEARRTVYISWESVLDRVAVEYQRVIEDFARRKADGKMRPRHYSIPVALAQEMLNKQAMRIKFATRSRDRETRERRALVQKKNIRKIKEIRARLMEGVSKRSL
jgi:1,2-diacylglycerol 3-alpha-glucosyltransferase